MNTTATMDDIDTIQIENPGLQLAKIREQKGYTVEYVANKLHLRNHIIELIDRGNFDLLPEPVFIKGYLRAYAKLLSVSPEPFLQLFNAQCIEDQKPERTLWQSKRESHKAEHYIRWFTIAFAIAVLVAVSVWWHNNRDSHSMYSSAAKDEVSTEVSLQDPNTEIKLTDLSKMQALLTPGPEMTLMEKQGD